MQSRLFLVWLLLAGLVTPSRAALVCDGVDDSAQGSLLSTLYTASTKTMTAWVTLAGSNPTGAGSCVTAGNVQGIVDTSGTVNRFGFTWRSSTQICGIHQDGSIDTRTGTTTGTGQTLHLALVHSGGNLTFYVDGVSAGTVASGDTFSMPGTLFQKLCSGTNYLAFNGRIHHLSSHNVAMPEAEIVALAMSRRPRLRRTAATGDWLFDNCADGASGNGVAFRDLSGNGNTITGDDGANNTGLTCAAGSLLSYPGGMH